MQENCLFGSEGGAKLSFVPTPIGSQLGPVLLRVHGGLNCTVDFRRTALRDLRDLCFRRGIEDRNPLTFLIARDEFTVDKILVAFHVILPRYTITN